MSSIVIESYGGVRWLNRPASVTVVLIAAAAEASPRVLLVQVSAPPHTTMSPSGFTAVSGTEPSFVARRSIDPAGIEPAGIEPAGIEPAGSEALAVELAAIVPTPVVPSCPAIATP